MRRAMGWCCGALLTCIYGPGKLPGRSLKVREELQRFHNARGATRIATHPPSEIPTSVTRDKDNRPMAPTGRWQRCMGMWLSSSVLPLSFQMRVEVDLVSSQEGRLLRSGPGAWAGGAWAGGTGTRLPIPFGARVWHRKKSEVPSAAVAAPQRVTVHASRQPACQSGCSRSEGETNGRTLLPSSLGGGDSTLDRS